jgi:hypothetical protein
VGVGVDRDWDGEFDESTPNRDVPAAPGLETRYGRAIGELAAENAELYKRVDYLEAQLKQKDARFDAWAREMAWREEEMKTRLERLEHANAERITPGMPARRVGERATPEAEKQTGPEPARQKASDQFIAASVGWGGVALTAAGEMLGTTAAADFTTLAGQVATAGAATLAWMRWRKEARDADRS